MAGGRPSKYNKAVAAKICALLSQGQSLRTVAKAKGVPSIQTIFTWMQKHPEFLEQYTRAKQESADAMIEEMLDIADDATNDWMEKNDKDGNAIGYQVNGEHVNRSRLRIETRKWLASKLKPKKYGDKITNEHQALDKEGDPIGFRVEFVNASSDLKNE